jgi:hypothetical protein
MITKSPAQLRRARDRPAGARRHKVGRYVRVGSVDVPRVHRGGDTDALDWRSDLHLLAILARGVKRQREARRRTSSPRTVTSCPLSSKAGDRAHRPAFIPAGAL